VLDSGLEDMLDIDANNGELKRIERKIRRHKWKTAKYPVHTPAIG
jgi:hypothetical protein